MEAEMSNFSPAFGSFLGSVKESYFSTKAAFEDLLHSGCVAQAGLGLETFLPRRLGDGIWWMDFYMKQS
jgi:hypothetical protein